MNYTFVFGLFHRWSYRTKVPFVILLQSAVRSVPSPDAPMFSWQGTISCPLPRFPLLFSLSHDPLQDVEDADVVDGHKGGEVRWHVNPFERRTCQVEGLQGLTFLHVPPLANKQERGSSYLDYRQRWMKTQFGSITNTHPLPPTRLPEWFCLISV